MKSHSKLVKKQANLPPKMTRIGMLSLGCPKTLVDSEIILGKLPAQNYQITDSVSSCDIALLNTCSFIRDAQEESIQRILELLDLKKRGDIRALIVMGCMVQKFPKALQDEFKQVDAFVGSGEYHKIPDIVRKVAGGEKIFQIGTPGYLSTSGEARIALTPRHYRYLKISEGCDHICSFCTIPNFRGKHRSRPLADVSAEAKRLATEGARELIITGQDTTYYGRDFDGKFHLPSLLKELDTIEGLEWLRVLYAYPSCITTDLMDVMAQSQRICHYLDMPLQHASDAMLTAMRRGITKRRTIDLIREFRKRVPGLAIRTTFIVGFPGETEDDFKELLDFMEEMQFERLGIFKYSQEEDSHAAGLKGQIAETLKAERLETAMLLQQKISRDNNSRYLGKTMKVLVEEIPDAHSPFFIGRSYMDAPEVDGNVYIRTKKTLRVGEFYDVRIDRIQEYDLEGCLAEMA